MVRQGGEFEEWYRREHPRLANGLYLISGSVDGARDATDEAFARAAASWARVRKMDSPTAWTFKVGLNLIRREARRSRRHAAAVERLGAAAPVATVELPDAELWAAVRSLPDRQRHAVVMRYVGDLPEAEIAAVLGVARGTVASNLSRALDTLAAKMVEQESQ
jgi:RNA polymerase sigma factor (sigma-70 family)